MNVLTFYDGTRNEWLFRLVKAEPAHLHVRSSDGSFWAVRPQRPTDFDEEGRFVGDAPPRATVIIQDPEA